MLISKEPLNLNAIAEIFDVSRPAISQHIKVLIECGLVEIKQEGRERNCSAKLEKLNEVADWIEPLRKLRESGLRNWTTCWTKLIEMGVKEGSQMAHANLDELLEEQLTEIRN